MANYYQRNNSYYMRNKRAVDDNRKLKRWVEPAIGGVASVLALLFHHWGISMEIILVPALLLLVLLVGTINKSGEANLPVAMAIILPELTAVMDGRYTMTVVAQTMALLALVIMAVKYRSFIWKSQVLMGDINLLIISYYLAVTNYNLDVVLLLKLGLTIASTCALTTGLVLALKTLFTDGTIYKLTK